jgi:hypothetical protein
MKSIVSTLAPLLKAEGIVHRIDHETLLIPHPGGFGDLEVADLNDQEGFIGLVGEDWHISSGDLGDADSGSPAGNVLCFIQEIFAGRFLLIEEEQPGEAPVKLIEDDLEAYAQGLPEGVQYRVYPAR